jgi:hypothetical protein
MEDLLQPNEQAAQMLSRVHLKNDEGWKKYDEVGVKLSNIPHTLTTWEIWKLLSPYGNIARIEIIPRWKEAKVNFWSVHFLLEPVHI